MLTEVMLLQFKNALLLIFVTPSKFISSRELNPSKALSPIVPPWIVTFLKLLGTYAVYT